MSTRKKILFGVLTLAMILALAAIGGKKYLQARELAYRIEIRGNISTVIGIGDQYMQEEGVTVVNTFSEIRRRYPGQELPKSIAGEDYELLFPMPFDRVTHTVKTKDGTVVKSSGAAGEKRPWYFF